MTFEYPMHAILSSERRFSVVQSEYDKIVDLLADELSTCTAVLKKCISVDVSYLSPIWEQLRDVSKLYTTEWSSTITVREQPNLDELLVSAPVAAWEDAFPLLQWVNANIQQRVIEGSRMKIDREQMRRLELNCNSAIWAYRRGNLKEAASILRVSEKEENLEMSMDDQWAKHLVEVFLDLDSALYNTAYHHYTSDVFTEDEFSLVLRYGPGTGSYTKVATP